MIIDEKPGRNFAAKAGLNVTGTIGVLVRAKHLGYIEMMAPLPDQLQQNSVWISNKLKEAVLKLAGE